MASDPLRVVFLFGFVCGLLEFRQFVGRWQVQIVDVAVQSVGVECLTPIIFRSLEEVVYCDVLDGSFRLDARMNPPFLFNEVFVTIVAMSYPFMHRHHLRICLPKRHLWKHQMKP